MLFERAARQLHRFSDRVARHRTAPIPDYRVPIHASGHLLEHLYREVRAPRIYEGTSEIQRTIIARSLYRDDGVR